MIKVGTVVPRMKVANVTYNTAQIIQTMNENADAGFLVYPELCLTGYTCGDLFGQFPLLDAVEEGLFKIANASNKLEGLTVVVGAPLRFENHLYNCAVYISEGVIVAVVPKINLPTYSEFYESRWFTSGKNIVSQTIQLGDEFIPFGRNILACDSRSGAIVGLDICEDLWVPDKPSTHACLAGANIIANLSASDEMIGKQDYRRTMVLQQSASCYCAYLYVSSATDESSTDLVFSGHSMIACNGRLLTNSIFPEDTKVETVVIDLESIEKNRRHQTTFDLEENHDDYVYVDVSIKPISNQDEITVDELVDALRKEGYVVNRNPFVPVDDEERGRRCMKILEIQANGLATRVRSTGIKNLVIGISGGLDSTLALLVCHQARKLVPDIHIIGYTLPSHGNTTSYTYNNALDLMRALDVEMHEVAIEEGVQAHLKQIGHPGSYQGDGDTTYENAQARMRTYILMDVANMANGLVVGTGDLSELALGWCTYNGDHMSMYAVNASVPKTLVQYICRTYAYICNQEDLKEVLLKICNTPISPELTPHDENGKIAQKTEDKIGKYDLNDFFLYYVLRYGYSPEKIMVLALTAYPELEKEKVREAMLRFFKRFFNQQFKRSCLPDGPKVGSVTLSPRGDWRMPSDASAGLWLEQVKKAQVTSNGSSLFHTRIYKKEECIFPQFCRGILYNEGTKKKITRREEFNLLTLCSYIIGGIIK